MTTASALETWSEPEKWVWEMTSRGEIANFNTKFQMELDPQSAAGWTEKRLISCSFLETVLLREPYKSELPRRGLRIAGAWITDNLDLANGRLASEWWIDKSRFENAVKLSMLTTD